MFSLSTFPEESLKTKSLREKESGVRKEGSQTLNEPEEVIDGHMRILDETP